MHWARLSLLLILVGMASTLGQSPDLDKAAKDVELPAKPKAVPTPVAEEGPIKPHATPDSGVREAFGDAGKAFVFDLEVDTPVYRYIWIDSTDEEDFKVIALAVNYISRASHVVIPIALPGPMSTLVRVDLRELFPGDNLADGIKGWEEFRFDPTYNLLLTPDVLQGEFGRNIPSEGRNAVVVRLNAPDLDGAAYEKLKALTGSQAPVVEWRYFLFRALSTIKDDGPFKDIFGGLYYDLRGIKRAKDVKGKEKATDEDLFFEQLGIGNIQAGETYERLLDRVRGDLRPSVFISDVTGKPRTVVAFHTPAEREGGSFGAVTWDVKDKSIDVRQHPVLSQIKPKIDAQEGIFPGPNGMPLFVAFNGEGALQDEVPFDVAVDRTIPAPHPTRLQPAIGCIRCHGPEETWKPLKDDVAVLLEGTEPRLKIFNDANFPDAADAQDRILGLHSVIPLRAAGKRSRQQRIVEKLLQRQRDDFVAAVFEVTGAWKKLEGKQDTVAVRGAQKVADVYGGYWYAPVDARAALLDIGMDVPAPRAPEVLTKLLSDEGEKVLGVQFESVRLQQLAAGGKISRVDWSLERSFAAGRVNKAVAALLQKGKP